MPTPKTTISISRTRYGPGAVTSYGERRTCAVPGCGTQLSRYNGADICAVHEVAKAS